LGEFFYNLIGETEEPPAFEVFNWSCSPLGVMEKTIRVSHDNPQRGKALLAMSQNSDNAIKSNRLLAIIERERYQLSNQLRLKVHYSSPSFKGPSEIIIDKENSSSVNLPLSFDSSVYGFDNRGPGNTHAILFCAMIQILIQEDIA
jgi:hypothetical protein